MPIRPTAVCRQHRKTVLASARAKCPRREDLPVETQLAMFEEDRQRDLRERPRRGQGKYPEDVVTDRPYDQPFPSASTPL